MNNTVEDIKRNAEIAQFKFSLIAPVIRDLYTEESRTAYYKRVTEKPLVLPNGKEVKYSYKTIEKWVSKYNNGGLDALLPRTRSDKGSTRVLTDVAIERIYSLKEQFPRLNATQIHQKLISEGVIPVTVSVDSVQRYIKHNDLKSASNPNIRDRKAFEEDEFGKLWQADTCYMPCITVNGESMRPYCLMIIDDHSRLLVGGGIFKSDNAANFQKLLKDAIATYGIPDKLYVDNGSSYANEQLSMICVSLGIVLIHTPVRDGASKGKVERHFRTLKERLIYAIDANKITSFEEFDALIKNYMREYNTTIHTSTGTTPLERYEDTRHHPKQPESRQWLEDCFYNRTVRKVRKDSTISIDKVSYDVPMQFISTKVDIRYIPDNMDSAYILYEGVKHPIRRTNKNENCRTKRNNPIDYSKVGV